MPFHPSSLPNLAGKVFVVTGATSGIGLETAAHLAEHNAHVYLCARSQQKAADTIDKIKSRYPQADLDVLQMNHNDLASVVKAADELLAKEQTLHGLVNNAGIMATPYDITKDGWEAQWQTNYLAHWVFTEKLLPLLLKTSLGLPPGSVRIVNISSSGHWYTPAGGVAFDDTSLKDEVPMKRYGQSKLANILHARTLHRLYGPGSQSARAGRGEIWFSIVHPGMVDTGLAAPASGMPGYLMLVGYLVVLFGGRVNSDKGSWTSLYCVAGQTMTADQSGVYFQRLAAKGWDSKASKDEVLAQKLSDWTAREMQKWLQ